MALRFVWDARKATANERKHGVGFLEATTVFDDPLSVTIPTQLTQWASSGFSCSARPVSNGCLWSPTQRAANRSGSSARDVPDVAKGEPMKKKTKRAVDRDTLRPEYDFRGGVRGKYVARYRAGTNVVVLDADVAEAFGNADAVNRALRALLDVVPARRAKRRSA